MLSGFKKENTKTIKDEDKATNNNDCLCRRIGDRHTEDHIFVTELRIMCARWKEIRWEITRMIFYAIFFSLIAAAGFESFLDFVRN